MIRIGIGAIVSALGESGATDFLAVPFGFGASPPRAIERTRAFLVELANR